jgi:hypothetical protein
MVTNKAAKSNRAASAAVAGADPALDSQKTERIAPTDPSTNIKASAPKKYPLLRPVRSHASL